MMRQRSSYGRPVRVIFLAVCALVVQAQAVELYVSTSGSDNNPGSSHKPFATIRKAQERARQLKQDTPDERVTVLIRGGMHKLDEQLVFEPQDSGTEDNPITYQAYPNEVPILYGGQRITGWEPLQQENAVNPKARGLLWSATVPAGWDIRQIFVDGKTLLRSMTPNTDDWGNWPMATIGEKDNHFLLPTNIVKPWSNAGDMQINYLPTPYSKWNHYLRAVTEINNNIVTLDGPVFRSTLLKPTKQIPVRIENTLEAIDTAGEWCIDTRTSRVYLWPPKGVDMRAAKVIAPYLEQAIVFKGDKDAKKRVMHIHLKGLAIQHVTKSGIALSAVEDCSIDSCRIGPLAGTGISAQGHIQRITISNCRISSCGHGGIGIGGSRLSLNKTNKNNTIENNEINDCGLLHWHSSGIHIGASENIVRNNLIHNMPYSGIQVGGVRFKALKTAREHHQQGAAGHWDEIDESDMTIYGIKKYVNGHNLIENNVVHDVMQQLEDGGAIYCHASHHNIVRNNIVYRLRMKGARGLYFDDDEMHSEMANNLVYECALSDEWRKNNMGILLHDNAHNYVHHNIIALTERIAFFPRGYGGHRVIDNVFVLIGQGVDPGNLFRNQGRYKDIKWDAGPNVMDHNVYWNSEDKQAAIEYLNKWQQKGWDKNSVVTNPGFKDINKRDFGFDTDSVAWKMGIAPIDTRDVGIQSDFAAVK